MLARKTATLALLLLLVECAHAWWNDDWSYRKEITVSTASPELAVTEGLTDIPVLLRLHTGNFGYFFDVKEKGADMRLLAGDDLTPLKYQVESWDPLNELGLVWVRVPQLAAGGKETFYLYYGNPLANAADELAAVTDDLTVIRLDFSGKGTPKDTTAYGNHASVITGEVIEGGLVGQGLRLQAGQGLVVPAAPSLRVASDPGFTASLWLKPLGADPEGGESASGGEVPAPAAASASGEAPAADAAPSADDGPSPGRRLLTATDGERELYAALTPSGLVAGLRHAASGEDVRTEPVPLSFGGWQHVALVLGPEGLALFVNGQAASAPVASPAVDYEARLVLGTEGEGVGVAAELDEVRVASTPRSATWLALQAANQGPADPLVSYGTDESRDDAGGGAHVGNFGIIFQSVFGNPEAVVEQGVIIVCGLMATIALLVMFFKALFLMRAEGASKRFLRAYQHLGQNEDGGLDLEGLYDAHRKFGDSPLFRVYRLGLDEVHQRVSPAVGAQSSGLDHKALASVQASMDSAMVRERQRMDSQMVLLTIAISGGPFIGLFGTVVGVMVTFAAIAQTGDVNITAIAPGMAAALLATVSGLGVAIPALFGYNYLGSRIKSLTADMHVFADELLSKINEVYGR